MEPKTGKRMVNRGEYWKAQGQRSAMTGAALLFLFMTLCFGLATMMSLLFTALALFIGDAEATEIVKVYYLLDSIGILGTFSFGCLAWNSTKATLAIDPGVPLTRANTAALPAPDTLVRASEQPQQAQEAVLLRAAAEGVERHKEQLVRASVGQK